MVEADFSGDFLNPENAKENDIITITGEGEYATIETKEKKKRVLNIPIEINSDNKIWTPWTEEGKLWVNKYGKDTKMWVGKKGQVKHVRYMSYGTTKVRVQIEPM
jgi:hypothetical protein